MTTTLNDPNSMQRDIITNIHRVPLHRAFHDSAVYFILFAAPNYPIFNYSGCSRASNTMSRGSLAGNLSAKPKPQGEAGLPQMSAVDGEAPVQLLSELTYGKEGLARQTAKNFMPLKIYLLPAFSTTTPTTTTSSSSTGGAGVSCSLGADASTIINTSNSHQVKPQLMQLVVSTTFRYHQMFYASSDYGDEGEYDGGGGTGGFQGLPSGARERKIGIAMVFASHDAQKVEWCQKSANFLRSRMNCLLDPCMVVSTNYWQRLVTGLAEQDLQTDSLTDATLIRAGVEMQVAFAHYLCPTRFIPFVDLNLPYTANQGGGDGSEKKKGAGKYEKATSSVSAAAAKESGLDPAWYSTATTNVTTATAFVDPNDSTAGADGGAASRHGSNLIAPIISIKRGSNMSPGQPEISASYSSTIPSSRHGSTLTTPTLGVPGSNTNAVGGHSSAPPSLIPYIPSLPKGLSSWWNTDQSFLIKVITGVIGMSDYQHMSEGLSSLCLPALVDFSYLTPTQSVAELSYEDIHELDPPHNSSSNNMGGGGEEVDGGSSELNPSMKLKGSGQGGQGGNSPGSPVRRGPPSPYAQTAKRVILVSGDKDRGLSLLGLCAFFFRNALHRSGTHSHGTLPLAAVSHSLIAGHALQLYPEPTLPDGEFTQMLHRTAYSSVLIINIALRTVIRYNFARAGLPSNVLIDLMPNNTWGTATQIVPSRTVGQMLRFVVDRIDQGIKNPTAAAMAVANSNSKGGAGYRGSVSNIARNLPPPPQPPSTPGYSVGGASPVLYHHYYTNIFRNPSPLTGSYGGAGFSSPVYQQQSGAAFPGGGGGGMWLPGAPFVPPPLPHQINSLCDLFVPVEHIIADFLVFFQLQAEAYRTLTTNTLIPTWDEVSNTLDLGQDVDATISILAAREAASFGGGGGGASISSGGGGGGKFNLRNNSGSSAGDGSGSGTGSPAALKSGGISPIAPNPPMPTGSSSLPGSSRAQLMPQSNGSIDDGRSNTSSRGGGIFGGGGGGQSGNNSGVGGGSNNIQQQQLLYSQMASVFGRSFAFSHLQLLSLMTGAD